VAARNKHEKGFAAHHADDSAPELFDIPGAAVCAYCGDSACPGMCEVAGRLQTSGVYQVIPWEQPSGRGASSIAAKFWTTAERACTEPEIFFLRVHEGSVGRALSFALLCEVFAVGSFVAVWGGFGYLSVPWLLRAVAADPWLSKAANRALLYGVPSFMLLLVFAHATFGIATHIGGTKASAATRERAPNDVDEADRGWSAALRFGLYGCAWDVLASPAGVLALLIMGGPKRVIRSLKASRGQVRRGTNTFLQSFHDVSTTQLPVATRISYIGAAIVTVVMSLLVLVGTGYLLASTR
jgi:hypothetical protein